MKTIHLLRHAKTEIGAPDQLDRDRALTERGIADAQALGRYWQKQQARFDRVLISPARRTQQTLQEINRHYQPPLAAQTLDSLYLASAGEIIHCLQALPEDTDSVLVIGHNPGLHLAALTLAPGGDRAALEALELNFPTCALAVLHTGARWQDVAPGVARLQQFLTRETVAAALA